MLKSTTTKPPRHKDDNEYYFVTEEEFHNTPMIEWAEFGGYYYGLQVSEVVENLDKEMLVYVGEANGIVNTNNYIKENFPQFKRFKFLMDIPENEIRANIEKENKYTDAEIDKRLSRSNVQEVAKKLNLTPDFAITTLNEETVELAYGEITHLI